MKLRRAFLGAVGALFLLWGIYTAVFGISQFRQELAQQDWRVSMATVTAVEQRWESSGGRHSSSKKVYDVTYEYAVNEESYTGELVGDATPREVGDSFDVKVDPAHPEISTAILEPQPDALVVNLLGGAAFCLIGVWLIFFPPGRKQREEHSLPGR